MFSFFDTEKEILLVNEIQDVFVKKRSFELTIFFKFFFSFSGDEGTSASENISLSQMKKKSRRIKSLDHNNAPNNQTNMAISDSDGGHQSPASVGRRRHTSSGQSQVRSLYDGLSHLYTDCDSRLRHIPTTNYAEKKKATNETSANETQENRVSIDDFFQSFRFFNCVQF